MNRNVVIGCVVAVLALLTLCVFAGLAGSLLFAPGATWSGFSLNPTRGPAAVESVATVQVQKEMASIPTLPSAKGSGGEVRPQTVLETDLTALYIENEPGVVAITTFIERGGQVGAGSGSGFIIDASGLIVTNEHVVADGTRVEVIFFDGTAAEATVLGVDVDSDLAVLRAELPDNVHPLPLGDSDAVLPGQWVVAIGNPFGLQNTMTVGIVSAVGRMIPARIGAFSIPQAIQTDAAINPGNSGGPLLNLSGEVVGVNAQIRTDGTTAANAGVGFAIPVNIVRRVAPVLSEGRAYAWPFIGISGQAVTMMLAEAGGLNVQRGAYVASVTPGSPADAAGLRGSTGTRQYGGIPVPVGGDVVVAANGEPVYDFADLLETVAFGQPGETITLTVLRDGQEIDIPVTLAQRPAR